VAWQARESFADPVFDIYLRRWNGAAWEELSGSGTAGGISSSEYDSRHSSVALTSSRQPIVAWEEERPLDPFTTRSTIFVQQWSGSAWTELGAGAGSGDGLAGIGYNSEWPMMVIDHADRTTVTWQEQCSSYPHIFLLRYNGSTWGEIGFESATTPLGGIGTGHEPSIALDATGNPVVAWRASGLIHSSRAYVRRWDAVDWVEIGEGSASGIPPSSSGLAGCEGGISVATDPVRELACVAYSEAGEICVLITPPGTLSANTSVGQSILWH
jgi:hypothetical protein